MAGKSRARLFEGLDEKPAKDYDPEALEDIPDQSDDDSNNSSADSDEEVAGTEHYVPVGKSKLRNKEAITLGPQYRGARVSRTALEESSDEDEDEELSGAEEGDSQDDSEEFDDPETADLEADHVDDDAEIDSDEAFGESDEENFKDYTFRGSSKPNSKANGRKRRLVAADFMSGSEDEEDPIDGDDDDEDLDEDDEDIDEEDEEEDSDDASGFLDLEASESDEDEEGSEDDEGSELASSDDEEITTKGRKATNGVAKAAGPKLAKMTAPLKAAAPTEEAKGKALRQQRRAFDALLNLRIRLQKALVATNSIEVPSGGDNELPDKPYEAAEVAALKLWGLLDNFRSTMLPADDGVKVGEKRKREVGPEDSSEAIWAMMQKTEEEAVAYRRLVFDRWSTKTQRKAPDVKPRMLVSEPTQSLVSVLDNQLVSTDRLVKRTRTPRSCAPVQAAKKVAEDADIYDDADFYQLLLKELVDQRTADPSAAPGSGAVPTVRWAAIKEAKVRKEVDRKASKGRKLRFTVHEKLQNFMAPEDRRSWEPEAIDRFFGTLFGQKLELKEDESEEEDIEMGGASLGETIRLFN